MPFVAGPSTTPSKRTEGILFAKLVASTTNRLIADQYSASSHPFFDITNLRRSETRAKCKDMISFGMRWPRCERSGTQPGCHPKRTTKVTIPLVFVLASRESNTQNGHRDQRLLVVRWSFYIGLAKERLEVDFG